MSYLIWNKTTQTVHRGERNEPYTVDGQPGVLADPLVELAVIRNAYPTLGLNERAVATQTVDLGAKTITYGWSVETYTPTAEELDERADATEASQLRTVYTALKNSTGTSGERLVRVERVCAFLLKREAKRMGLVVA